MAFILSSYVSIWIETLLHLFMSLRCCLNILIILLHESVNLFYWKSHFHHFTVFITTRWRHPHWPGGPAGEERSVQNTRAHFIGQFLLHICPWPQPHWIKRVTFRFIILAAVSWYSAWRVFEKLLLIVFWLNMKITKSLPTWLFGLGFKEIPVI